MKQEDSEKPAKIKSQFMNWNFSEKLCHCNAKPDKKKGTETP